MTRSGSITLLAVAALLPLTALARRHGVRRPLVRDLSGGQAGLQSPLEVGKRRIVVARSGTGRHARAAGPLHLPRRQRRLRSRRRHASGIPQNNRGDHDSDDNGGPDDGDGGV